MLSDTKAKNLKPTDKKYRTADTDGLYIEVSPNGKKRWVFRYTEGKRRWKTIGEFPMVSLREAREIRDQKRRMLFDGVPLEEPVDTVEEIHTFKDVAEEWYEKNSQRWASQTARVNKSRFEMHVFQFIGKSNIKDITTKEMLEIAKRLESLKQFETARRVIQLCSQVFRYAIIREYCSNDPTYALKGELVTVKVRHLPSLTDPRDVAMLVRNIDAYPQSIVRYAMQFSALVFCRPGEVRRAEWAEIDIAKQEWRIPDTKMKMRRTHIVPLARQTIELLKTLQQSTGHGRYIFPNGRALAKGDRPMSENAVLVALRSMGYGKDQMTAHGFRSMASTLLNENGFHPDWIERQLAHVEGNSVRAAYNYAEYLKERKEMMQWWADYLDSFRG